MMLHLFISSSTIAALSGPLTGAVEIGHLTKDLLHKFHIAVA
jgi:hypothetical protein